MDKLEIDIPIGKEIDIEKSDFSTGIIYLKNKCNTLEDIIYSVTNMTIDDIINLLTYNIDKTINNKIIVYTLLSIVASYLNKTRRGDCIHKYYINYDGSILVVIDDQFHNDLFMVSPYFNCYKLAIEAIKLFEDYDKSLLKQLFI